MASATPPSHALRQFLSTNGLPFSISGIVSDNAKSHVSYPVPLKQVIQPNQIQYRQRQKSPPRQATQTQPMCRWNSSCASSTTAPQEVEIETNQSKSLPCPPRRSSSPIIRRNKKRRKKVVTNAGLKENGGSFLLRSGARKAIPSSPFCFFNFGRFSRSSPLCKGMLP